MRWFRRAVERGAQAQRDLASSLAPESDPADEPAALLESLFSVVAEVNRSAGRLPPAAVVAARAVLDVVREIIETSGQRPLDIRAVISVRSILEDFLPTTIQRYLAVDPTIVDLPRPSGRTPAESLLEQLDVLWLSATELLEAIKAQDADALLTQGNFLRTKFTGSDLDL